MIHYLTRLDPAQCLDPFVILAQPKIGLGLDPFCCFDPPIFEPTYPIANSIPTPPPQAGVVHQKVVRTSHGKEKACSILTVNSTRKLTINWQQILALLIYTSRANLITSLFRISEILFVYKYFIKEFLY